MQGILKQMVGPWMRDPAPRKSLKGSRKRIKSQSQETDCGTLCKGCSFLNWESWTKIISWDFLGSRKSFPEVVVKYEGGFNFGVGGSFTFQTFFNRTSKRVTTSWVWSHWPRSMLLSIKDQNQGSGSRSQLAALTRSHEWMRPGPDPSSQRNQHSNHSAPDAPTSTTWARYTLLMHLLYPGSESEGGGSDNSLTCLDFHQPQALWFQIFSFISSDWTNHIRTHSI